MSFKTASAILRGVWLLDKKWADAQMPMIISIIQGKAKYQDVFQGSKLSRAEGEDHAQPQKVLSNRSGVLYSVNSYSDLSRIPFGSIAMVDITGPVTKYGDMCAWGSVDHVATINRLASAQNISGIILNVDSPGGECAGTSMLADAIKDAKAQKPVIGLIDDGMAASAAYWIVSACTEIYTTKKTDWIGSIGVYTTIADWYGYFASEGLNVRDIYAPQSTEKNKDYRDALAGDDTSIKEDLAVIAQEFINTVKTNRAGKLTSNDWAKGNMYYSKDAISMGLIDGQKTMSQVLKRMDTLVQQKQQSNSSNMAFEKTLSAAKAESFEVVDGGFLLEEQHLNDVEAHINSLEAANQNLQLQESTAQEALTAAETALTAANATIEQHLQTIAARDAEIATLNAGPAKGKTETSSSGDNLHDEKGEPVVSETTKEAIRLHNLKNGK